MTPFPPPSSSPSPSSSLCVPPHPEVIHVVFLSHFFSEGEWGGGGGEREEEGRKKKNIILNLPLNIQSSLETKEIKFSLYQTKKKVDCVWEEEEEEEGEEGKEEVGHCRRQ